MIYGWDAKASHEYVKKVSRKCAIQCAPITYDSAHFPVEDSRLECKLLAGYISKVFAKDTPIRCLSFLHAATSIWTLAVSICLVLTQ